MAEIHLIRHGQTTWNKIGKYTGQTDVELTEEGREQARKLQPLIADIPFVAAYSSDLQRAVETAEIALSGRDVALQQDKRIREIHQGEWEGMHVDEIKERFALEFEHRRANPLTVGAPGGETIQELRDRVLGFLAELQQKHAAQEHVLISAHGVVIALVRVEHAGIPMEKVWDYIPANAELISLSFE